MKKGRNKIKPAVAARKETDSAKWRDATLKSLTHTQERIRSLCEAFMAGEITTKELMGEIPSILNSEEQE
jgi:hypothetical protein